MRKSRLFQLAAAAASVTLPVTPARGVVFYPTGDPSHNTTAPGGTLANSGWQYELSWRGGFLATPVAPHYFVSAKHVGGGVGDTIFLPDGSGATVTSVQTFGADLNLYGINQTFYSYAPLYNSSVVADGSESGKNLVIIGRGGPRGTEVHANNNASNPLLGWNWVLDPNADHIQRWGTNVVAGFQDAVTLGDNKLLRATFDQPGFGDSTGNEEGALVAYDSGGGIFVQGTNGEWKLAGVNFGVDQYRYAPDAAPFAAALFDTRGLFTVSDTPAENNLPISGATNVPSKWYASRVGPDAGNITNIINLPPTWKTNGSGNWTSANFANGTPANSAGAEADFRSVISAPVTVTLTGNQTVGTLNFDNVNRYTLSGSTIIFDTAGSNARVNVASGSHTIASALTLNKDLDLYVIQPSSTMTLSGQMSASGRTINQVGPGTVEYKNVRAGTLNVQQGNARILFDSANSTAGTSKISNLNLATGSRIDLTNNDMIVTVGSLSAITSAITTGRNGGSWNGTGLTSSTAATTKGLTGLGVAQASSVISFGSASTATWSGQTVDPNSILVKYTYAGDLNLDGMINGDDFFHIDNGFSSHLAGYANGDINYDGKVNADDYFIIDSNYPRQAGIVFGSNVIQPSLAAGVTTVPEPTALAAACVFASSLVLRRRRRA